MPIKEISLLAQDLMFYLTGKSDLGESPTIDDEWLYPVDSEYQLIRDAANFCPRDANGIPVRRYREPLGDQYLICRVTAFAIAHWNRLRRTGAEESRRHFLNIVNWLAAVESGRFEHHYSVAGMAVPWISCISQGEAASVMARAFILTGEAHYRVQARKAVEPLMVPVEQGGLQSRLPDGRPFLEEYPGSEYRHVLNGCLYALIGIHDVLRLQPEDSALKQTFEELIDAVGANLPAWDENGWSVYDFPFEPNRPRNLNTMTYQILQTVQLRYLGRVSGDGRLTAMADKWERSAASLPARLGALYRKVAYRLSAGW